MSQPAAQPGTGDGTDSARRRGRRTEADRTAELEKSLPKGISIGEWPDGRRKPYYVRYGASRTLESFTSEQARNDRAETLGAKREEHGSGVLDIDYLALKEWQDFRRRCPAPLAELERLWTKHEQERSAVIGKAAEKYMLTWTGKEPAFRHVRLHVRRLVERFNPLPVADITPEMLREYNAALADPDTGKPMSDATKYDYRKTWNVFFRWCVMAKLISVNPCDLFTLRRPVEQERDILTARQIFDLLKANRDEPVIGRLVFEIYGGLRASSVERLTPEHVKRDIKGIRLPGYRHKSGKVKFRQKHPEVLWAWYDHAGERMWEITESMYDGRKREAFVRARVENPGNVLRNSFATYMLAWTNNPGLVARLMQHTSLSMLEIYEGVATEQDAILVMAMSPDAVALEWEDFVGKYAKAP